MAAKSSKSKPHVNGHSARKANAMGFAKRRSRKDAATIGRSSDVYEFSSGKNKNMITGKDEDAVINSDEDEEIESDDAFEESDEDKFAGFSFRKKPSQKKKPKTLSARTTVRFADVDLNEDNEVDHSEQEDTELEEGDVESGENSEEFLDVLDVLDGRGEPDLGDDDDEVSREVSSADEDGETGYDEGENGDDVDATSDALTHSDHEEQLDVEALDNLETFVSQLGAGEKRKAEDAEGVLESSQPPARKRRMLKERTEAGIEGEFNAYATSGSKLELEDLLKPLASMSSSLQSLKKATKPLMKGDALAAPLPQRTQERIDREAAYEQTKKEVDKWNTTMRRIKEAEHLSFPLQVPQKVNVSNPYLASKFKPSNALENAVDKLLKAAQMREESDIAKTEELKMNNQSIEEVAERRAQLRKMRDLMFRAEVKAKRIAKIKSKTYRKIQRKSKDRIKALIKEAEGVEDGDGHDAQIQREMERARERATLRHKNTGKWAKAMRARGELEVDQRRAIEEMLDKGEKLRTKIHGLEGSASSEDDDDNDDDVDDIKANAFEELKRAEQSDDEAPSRADKGVFSMKFMQDAMAREAQTVKATADDFRDEMGRLENLSDTQPVDEDEVDPRGVQVQRTGGRMIYKPVQATVGNKVPSLAITLSESSSTLKSSEPPLQSPEVASQATIRSPPLLNLGKDATSPPEAEEEPNPWLISSVFNEASLQPRKNGILISKNSTSEVKSKHTMKKQRLKGEEERQKAVDDAVVEISMEATLTLLEDRNIPDGVTEKAELDEGPRKERAQQQGHQVDGGFEDSDDHSEVEAEEQQINSKTALKGMKALEQRDLVARAFAGDNVVQEFEILKQREIAADAPHEEDLTLPGWGSWGGAGITRNPNAKKFVKKVAGIDPKSRADHGKAHLVISEKKDKRAEKYLVKDLPYPYTSKAQFERNMEIPIGPEWNTRVGFQRQTLPRVVKKMGTIINPLEKVP